MSSQSNTCIPYWWTWVWGRYRLLLGPSYNAVLLYWKSLIFRVVIVTRCRRVAKPPKGALFKEFNAPPIHLVCNAHLIANFLGSHMSLVVVMNCGAGITLQRFEISMFWISHNFVLYTYPKIYCRCGLRKYKIGKSAIMQGRPAVPYIMHDL